MRALRLRATPLAAFERDGLRAAQGWGIGEDEPAEPPAVDLPRHVEARRKGCGDRARGRAAGAEQAVNSLIGVEDGSTAEVR